MTSLALNYISTYSLPCQVFLDSHQYAISGTTLTWTNLMSNSNYDFLQINSALQPLVGTYGFKFAGNQYLYPRTGNLFNNATSYSIIAVTKNLPATNQKIFEVGKTNVSLPMNIAYNYYNFNLDQQFSQLNVANTVEFSNIITAPLSTICLSHDILYGTSVVNLNGQVYNYKVNTDKGYILNDFNNFILGNSSATLPFLGELVYFIVFIPQITNLQLDAVLNLLELDRPDLLPNAKEFNYSDTAILDTSTLNSINYSNIYQFPVTLLNYGEVSILNLQENIILLSGVIWNQITTSIWNTIDLNLWNNMH
jgi:hypothetical protein